ncbi:MAG: ACT domain-containing protein, partial [Armatimonadota bacterium]|nr:ACT domain-containing protein [Armatimonadota bacterium]
MKVKQLSIFLENQSGRLAEVTGALGAEGINIRALSLADTSGFGILRLIVSDIAKARKVLQEKGFTVKETDVIAVEVPDRPGGLAEVLSALAAEGINIE